MKGDEGVKKWLGAGRIRAYALHLFQAQSRAGSMNRWFRRLQTQNLPPAPPGLPTEPGAETDAVNPSVCRNRQNRASTSQAAPTVLSCLRRSLGMQINWQSICYKHPNGEDRRSILLKESFKLV